MIDINKEYMTRDGRTIELLRIIDPKIIGEFCVIGIMYGNYTSKCSLETWTLNGDYIKDKDKDDCSINDLVEKDK